MFFIFLALVKIYFGYKDIHFPPNQKEKKKNPDGATPQRKVFAVGTE